MELQCLHQVPWLNWFAVRVFRMLFFGVDVSLAAPQRPVRGIISQFILTLSSYLP